MDEFANFTKGLSSPATKHFLVQPDDVADLPILPRAIYCEADGVIAIRDGSGVTLSYTMMAGDRLDFRGVRVLATGTSGIYYGWS